MKKFLSVFITLILLILMTVPVFKAYRTTVYHFEANHPELVTNADGAYLMTRSGGDCHVEKLAPATYFADLNLRYTIAAVGVFHETIVALCNNVDNNQLEVYTYRADTDILDSFAINKARYYGDAGFCYDGSSVYLVSSRRNNMVERYSTSGVLLDEYSFSESVAQLGSDFNGSVFAVSNQKLYRLSGNRFSPVSRVSITAPAVYFSDHLISDAEGRIVDDNSGMLFRAGTDFGRNHACRIGNTIYCPDGGTIYAYRMNTGEKFAFFELGASILGLYADSGVVNAVTANGEPTVVRIETNEFETIRKNSSSPDKDGSYQISKNLTVSSSVYRIDNSSYSICNIPAGTTLAQLKQNLEYDGFSLRLYRDGNLKTSGKCATGMTAEFDSDSIKLTYELSVIGDITGEGSVNQRDLDLLMRYLLGSASFNGVYSLSADLSDDGTLDVKDLALLHRMI